MSHCILTFSTGLVMWMFVSCSTVESPSTGAKSGETSLSTASELPDFDRPAPILPAEALFMGKYANLELTIAAARDGSVKKVAISKPSHAKVYDDYIRRWVEEHWKMPAARQEEADLRTFIAPIVFPESGPRDPKRYPPPPYPSSALAHREEGFVFLSIHVDSTGKVDASHVLKGSGHPSLDNQTLKWVSSKWLFPEGHPAEYYVPFVFLIH